MRKSLVLILTTILLLAVGVAAVYAQGGTDDDDNGTPGFPCRGGCGMMMGRDRYGLRWGGAILDTVAGALGLEEDDLRDELQDGKTVAEIAGAQGVALQDVIDAVVAGHADDLAEAVEDGTLTQAQADAMQALLAANLEAHFTQEMPGLFGRGAAYGPRGMMMGRGWDAMPRMRGGRMPRGMMEPWTPRWGR